MRAEEELPLGSCLDIKQTIIVGPFNMVLSGESLGLGCCRYIYIYIKLKL